MTRSSLTTKYTAAVILLLMFISTFVVSCTKVDNSLGEGLIPNDQEMTMNLADIEGIDAYITQYDSFPTANIGDAGYLGSVVSPIFGKTWAAFGCQYISYSFSNGDTRLGYAPEPDSLVISLFFKYTPQGDTSKKQTINVYELKDRLRRDTGYYAFSDIGAMADMSEPLFSFDYKGETDYIKLSLTSQRAKDLMKRLTDTTGRVYDDSDEWYKRFPGLYFVPAATSPEDASIIRVDLDSTRLSLYAHNYTDASATTVKDSLFWLDMIFNNGVTYPNASANQFRHDYTGTEINTSLFADTLTTSTPLDVTYAQGMGGVVTYLRFSDYFINELKSKLIPPYKTLAINKALLEIAVEDPTIDRLNEFITRVGLYSNYNRLKGIVDYDYELENSGETLPFGGYLNRTFNKYQMDISSFVQRMLIAEKPEKTMVMGPSGGEQLSIKGTVFNTSSNPDSPKMKVKVTYTLVR